MKRLLVLFGLLFVAVSCRPNAETQDPGYEIRDASEAFRNPYPEPRLPRQRSEVRSQRSDRPAVSDLRPLTSGISVPKPNADVERWTEAAAGFDLLYFTATWCPACRQQQPVLDRLRGQGYHIRIIDIDDQPDMAALFGISSIPAYVASIDGQVVLDQHDKPKISHGMTGTSDPDSWRVDEQAVLDLFDERQPQKSAIQPPSSHSTVELKQIAASHNWRRAPAYVGYTGNLNRQDYLDHLRNDHGYTTEQLDWTAIELFQLHSAIHCPNCSRRLTP